MVLFKYGFIFLAGAGFGAAMAHRGQHYDGHRHGPCWRRHWGHRGGDDLGRRHHDELDHAANERRRGYYSGHGDADRDTEEGEYRTVKKNKSAAPAAATADY